MDERFGFALLAFTSIFAMVNPVSAIPIFLATTAAHSAQHRAATLRRAVLTAFVILASFGLLGSWIFNVFGITTPAFRIAGGFILFGVGFDMIRARRVGVKATEEEEAEGTQRDDIGIVPLGMPTLAGPGAITTVVAMISQAESPFDAAWVYASLAVVMLLTWLVLSIAPRIAQRLGKAGLNVFSRIMGLIVMVVGVQFVIDGATTVVLDVARRIAQS